MKRKSIKESQENSRIIPFNSKSFQLHQLHCSLFTPSPEQYLLNTVSITFENVFKDPQFNSKLTSIKAFFKTRDFNSIFSNPELLPIYVVEYIAGRALCYRDTFLKLQDLQLLLQSDNTTILCLGSGNGAELLGISAATVNVNRTGKIHIINQDMSDYGVIPDLTDAIHSHYHEYLNPNNLSSQVLLGDLCDSNNLESLTNHIQNSQLITSCFLLNEIFTLSKTSFAKLISCIVNTIKKGAYFLVIDSAGSFSECTIGESKQNQYMLFNILDSIQSFECLEKHDSVWYRFPKELDYPLPLRNMRFFLRLYRKR
ncbi:hypothetical protein BC833DRAFT_328790 [Globomyces pollinis-pini]|nr:hypothetical protein BC833DRAFT_328790 [Globomyces pollinis-pini]